MNTLELKTLLGLDEKIRKKFYYGVFAQDQFKSNTDVEKQKCAICIVNEQPSTAADTHWILVFVDENKVVFFDSFGRPPSHFSIGGKVNKLLKGKKKVLYYPTRQLQSAISNRCGGFVMLAAFLLSRDQTLTTILSLFREGDTFDSVLADL